MSDELKKHIDYDPDTGKFTRKISAGNRKAGQDATSFNRDGYGLTMVNGKRYASHRLAWKIHYGVWPDKEIDHINGCPSDNRISNLRLVDRRENMSNTYKHRSGKLVGSYFHKQTKIWMARIRSKGITTYLGLFDSELDGHLAYMNELKRLRDG